MLKRFLSLSGLMALVVFSLARCSSKDETLYNFPTYQPGKRLTAEAYKKAVSDLSTSFSLSGLAALNTAVDGEMIAAMYETFSSAADFPQTRVIIGSNGGTMDGQNGLRIIWRRKVPARSVDISVNVFFKYENGKYLPKGGPDSIRVRSMVGGGQFGWLSYDLKLNADGSIASLEPGVYQKDDGSMKDGIPSEASPTRCDSCHYHGMLPSNPDSEDDYTVDKNFYIQSALNMAPEADRPGLAPLFKKPRESFLPPGLLNALSARGRQLGL